MLRRLAVVSLALVFCASVADAQSPLPRRPLMGLNGEPLQDDEMVVQAQRSFNVAIDSDKSADAQREEAVRMLYRMAERECTLLLDTIAVNCSLATINTSVSSNDDYRIPTIRASSTFSMRVKVKPRATP